MKTEKQIMEKINLVAPKEGAAKLKAISRKNNIRIYQLTEAMIAVFLENEDFQKEAITIAVKSRIKTKQIPLSQKVASLPENVREKLKSMSTNEIQSLIERLN